MDLEVGHVHFQFILYFSMFRGVSVENKIPRFSFVCFFGAANGVSVYVAYHRLQALVPVCVCVRMSVFLLVKTQKALTL